MSKKTVFGVCPHDCPDTCSFVSMVENGRISSFSASKPHPITNGWLCAKVRDYPKHVYHPDRLLHPLRRVGPKGSGQWAQISWEDAIGEIGDRWREIMAAHGAEAILPYSYSGTLGIVQMGVADERLWNRMGASRLDRAICGAAAEFAVKRTLGIRHSPPYHFARDSRLIIIWGHNPVSTAPHFMPHLKAAQRAGATVVVIDPRRTRTAKGASWHIAPKPTTDGALALGLAHVIVAEGLHDEAWLHANTVGWPQFRARLADYPPDKVAEICGVAEADIVKLARLYATTKPALIKIADGLQRHLSGGQTVRTVCALPALTGQYGVRGGGLGYSTSGYAKWDTETLGHYDDCPPPGRVVNMNRLGAALLGEAADPPVKSLFVYGANPVTTAPNAGRIVRGLQREDLFTVVHELFMTDTAVYADIILPATSQLEQTDLHRAYGTTVMNYNAPAIKPLGEAKSNWAVMRLLAEELGFPDYWLHQTEDEIIEELLTESVKVNPYLQGVTLAKLKRDGFVQMDIPLEVPFADHHFPTPSGKVELFSKTLANMGLDPLPGWTATEDGGGDDGGTVNGRFNPNQALNLITAAAHHFTTSTFANQPDMLKHEGTPFVEIHPDDAAVRGIVHGEQVVVENGRGACELRAVVTDGIRQGALASPKGRWGRLSKDGRNVNWTTSDALGDMAGQSTFHANRVWIRKVELGE